MDKLNSLENSNIIVTCERVTAKHPRWGTRDSALWVELDMQEINLLLKMVIFCENPIPLSTHELTALIERYKDDVYTNINDLEVYDIEE